MDFCKEGMITKIVFSLSESLYSSIEINSMSGQPNSNILIHHTIDRIKSHWDELRENIYSTNEKVSYSDKWLPQIDYLKQLSFHHSVAIALWDIISNRFLFVIDERNITKYDTSLYTSENGVDFSLANFHPKHIHAIHLMNQCISECHKMHAHFQHYKLMANVDALYRIGDGSYMHMLQQIVPVETNDSGQPFLFLSYIRDITHLKKQLSASLVFTTPDTCKLWHYNMEKREMEVIMPFTAQEKKILELLSEGKQTKYIAEQLSLSPHTVNTHRRRLLAKTSCIDTTALTAYCQLTGLI